MQKSRMRLSEYDFGSLFCRLRVLCIAINRMHMSDRIAAVQAEKYSNGYKEDIIE